MPQRIMGMGAMEEQDHVSALVAFVGARLFACELHERAHEMAARLLGHAPEARQIGCALTVVPGLSKHARAQAFVRHSGWIASAVLAFIVHRWFASARAVVLGFWLVALEAICSDLLGVGKRRSSGDRFWCGNFG